jgi:hypothetical protein
MQARLSRNGGVGIRPHRTDVRLLRHAMLAVPGHLQVAGGADGDALRQHRVLLGRGGRTRHRQHRRALGGGTRNRQHRRTLGDGTRNRQHRRTREGGPRHRQQHRRTWGGGTRHRQQHRRSPGHGLHRPEVEASELASQGDGGAAVAAEHYDAAGEVVVGAAEAGVVEAERVGLARGVGELGDAEVVAVDRVLVLQREAGHAQAVLRHRRGRRFIVVDAGAGRGGGRGAGSGGGGARGRPGARGEGGAAAVEDAIAARWRGCPGFRAKAYSPHKTTGSSLDSRCLMAVRQKNESQS